MFSTIFNALDTKYFQNALNTFVSHLLVSEVRAKTLGAFVHQIGLSFSFGIIKWSASQSFMVHDASWWRNYAMGSVRLSHLTIVLAMS